MTDYHGAFVENLVAQQLIAILFTSVEMRQIDQEIGHYANLQIHPGVDMLSLSLSIDRRGGETYGSDKPATQRNNEGIKEMKNYCSHNLLRALATASTLMAMVGTASSTLISIDFEGQPSQLYSGSATTSGGLVPFPGQTGAWNALNLGATGSPVTEGITSTRTASALNDGNGATTTISFDFNTGNAAFNSFDGSNITVSDNLGKDVAFISAGAIAWRFTGLLANTSYDIRIFGQTDARPTEVPYNFADFTAGGLPVQTTTSSQNYVDFTVVSDGSGVINGTFAHSGSGVSSMSGIQIQGNLVPEPSAALLLGVGGLLAMRRRR